MVRSARVASLHKKRIQMITIDDLQPFRTSAPDYAETEALKSRFLALRKTRDPFFLAESEMEEVFRWKLGNQYGRGEELRGTNPAMVYESVTRACFEVRCGSLEYEAKVRIGLLTAVPGIGVPIASAVLALVDPSRYCVIDFRGWRAVFDEDRRSFSIVDYLKYREAVQSLAQDLGWCIQETDLAIWCFDERRNGRAS